MILKFPDLDTLRLALTTSGVVPPAVWQAPAVAGLDDQGQLWLEPSATPARAAQNELRKLNVQAVKSSGAEVAADVCCWLEILPLVADLASLTPPEQTPILFEMPGEQLARLCTEMLRLGNDRQSFRWLEELPAGKNTGDGPRALLRVIGPPYYSLLRALDAHDHHTAPRAYVERAPRVWAQLGHTHPLIDRIKPPKDKVLLLRPPHQWLFLDDTPFRDVYDVLEFNLATGKVAWKDGKLNRRYKVSLRLAHGSTAEPAELWVLRDNPVEELNTLVQNADDHLLSRLSFAVGQVGGQGIIVLRVRPSKLPPPVLVVKGEGFRQYLKIPNLYLPCGWRLHPPLRRDVVRKLLAEEPAVLTWLYPGDEGAFTPESLPDDVFRPLTDWVEYVIDHERQSLEAWVQAARFDFESFVCEDESSRPRKPPAPDKGKAPQPKKGADKGAEAFGTAGFQAPKKARDDGAALDDVAALARTPPNALRQQLTALEEKFVSLEGALDAPERQALWPEMANLNAALNNVEEAGLCRMNQFWAGDDWPTPALWAWFRAEALAKPMLHDVKDRTGWAVRAVGADGRPRNLPGEDLDRLLALKEPPASDLRTLVAYLAWAARQEAASPALAPRLNGVQRFLEAHERLLPVRAVWLAWLSLSKLAHGDVLGLARARDRLLERLFSGGMRPEHDLPSFLRFAGQPTSQRFRAVRTWMTGLCDTARKWIKEKGNQDELIRYEAPTAEYIDLIFSFGLARFGEADASRDLLKRAQKGLGGRDEVHQFLLDGFRYRIEQALQGRPHGGPLPDPFMQRLEDYLTAIEKQEVNNKNMPRYILDRMRQRSRILEPDQKYIDPYHRFKAVGSDFETELANLASLRDGKAITELTQRLLAQSVSRGGQGHEVRSRVIRAALEAAPRVGEAFGVDLLVRLSGTYDALSQTEDTDALIEQKAKLLERGLFVAAHFARNEHIQPLIGRFQKLLQSVRGAPNSLKQLDSLAVQCFRGLRKLGLRDEIDLLLRQMADVVLEGQDVQGLGRKGDLPAHEVLQVLLHVAAQWFFFGRERQAEPILNAVRNLLYKSEINDKNRAKHVALSIVYAATIGQAPVELACKGIDELFALLRGVHDKMTTSPYYSQSHLGVIEAVVLSVVSDDFAMGGNTRRWLDDDEFLVRKRLHRDFRAASAGH